MRAQSVLLGPTITTLATHKGNSHEIVSELIRAPTAVEAPRTQQLQRFSRNSSGNTSTEPMATDVTEEAAAPTFLPSSRSTADLHGAAERSCRDGDTASCVPGQLLEMNPFGTALLAPSAALTAPE